jgi:SAM-dependent methyltransferase
MKVPEKLWMLRHTKRHLSLVKQLSLWGHSMTSWQRFWDSYSRYKQLAAPDRQPEIEHLYPCLGDDTVETEIEATYFYQDAWAFEQIVKQKPSHHYDVGSHHKFVALLSKVCAVTMVDIRPLSLPLDTLTFQQGSILSLPFENESIESLSSLCVVEHIGLGRYGDPLDPDGTEKAVAELKRVIKPGGSLYVSIPIDDSNRIYFNAHRAFTEEYILRLFDSFSVVEAKYIYGNVFGDRLKSGFGTGCYHFKRF